MSTTKTTVAVEQLRQLIDEELPHLIEIRHDLHAHPELGYQERRTSDLVQRELQDLGIPFVAQLAGGTGVLGHLEGRSDKATGLRADMDALPIEEQTGAEYASRTPGCMHACGHDGHTTILIGAARVLARLAREHALPRPVSFLFQPAEEGGAGGRRMVEDGCLDGRVIGPPIEHMFGLHGWPRLDLGRVATRSGPLLASADMFDIELRGVGSHAAFPHLGRDPVLAAAALVTGLQQLASRNTDPLDSLVVSVTQIHAGTTHNIIPGTATISGTVRTLTPGTHEMVQTRLREIATSIAIAHGCDAVVNYKLTYPVTRNDEAAVEIVMDTARTALGKDAALVQPTPVMGAEDFAFYCQEVPSCFFFLGLRPAGETRCPTCTSRPSTSTTTRSRPASSCSAGSRCARRVHANAPDAGQIHFSSWASVLSTRISRRNRSVQTPLVGTLPRAVGSQRDDATLRHALDREPPLANALHRILEIRCAQDGRVIDTQDDLEWVASPRPPPCCPARCGRGSRPALPRRSGNSAGLRRSGRAR